MNDQISLVRTELENYLNESGISLSNFATISGINSGDLSRVMNGTRPMSMRVLDKITSALGLAEDYFFSDYVDVCLFQSKVTWRRVRPLLYRCAELGRIDCIGKIVNNILDDLNYVPVLFDVAEDFFTKKRYPAAEVIYKGISQSEKFQHSERLALSQYRLFLISLGENMDSNYRAATIFEGYVDRLELTDRLRAIVRLAHVYGSLGRWNKVDMLAQDLYRDAKIQYKLEKENSSLRQKSSSPAYYYVLYSHLMRATVCEENEDFKQALSYVALYEDTDWIQEDTVEARRISNQFKEWAKLNRLLYRLKSGELQVLPEYINQVAENDRELPIAIHTILSVANQYQVNIDDVLTRFSDRITYRKFPNYSETPLLERHSKILIELGIYYLKHKPEKGIETILQGLEFSVKCNNDGDIIRCMAIFEQNRGLSTLNEENKYKYLVNEVRILHEKNSHYSSFNV
ncbi:helix-turn-helix domain-containing protein [Paenibacillus glucanolyticus]|uniref:helix-turn-helix domain-containing protein n=1 Tax=Paenibacillus glucanolyticus TaxID=59843 RepID=UPI0009F8C89D|nr:helix-turn-helix transcriptional regulator [Paenibacillus glucanolyticus]